MNSKSLLLELIFEEHPRTEDGFPFLHYFFPHTVKLSYLSPLETELFVQVVAKAR